MVAESTGEFTSPPPEAPQSPGLEANVRRQVDRYIRLGYHRWVYRDLPEEQAEERYRADFALSPGAAQPEAYRGRFDTPVVIDPRVPLVIQCDLIDDRVAGLASVKERSGLIDIRRIVDQIEHPDGPYLIFTHDGERYRDHGTLFTPTVQEIQASFAQDEVGNTLHEVTGLYTQFPGHFGEGRGGFAAGSRDENGNVPIFFIYRGHPNISQSKEYGVSGKSCTFSRGRNVIELGSPKAPAETLQKAAA